MASLDWLQALKRFSNQSLCLCTTIQRYCPPEASSVQRALWFLQTCFPCKNSRSGGIWRRDERWNCHTAFLEVQIHTKGNPWRERNCFYCMLGQWKWIQKIARTIAGKTSRHMEVFNLAKCHFKMLVSKPVIGNNLLHYIKVLKAGSEK